MFFYYYFFFRWKVKALCALTCDEANATYFAPNQLAATDYASLNSLHMNLVPVFLWPA